MRREIWTGRVIPSRPWNDQTCSLKVLGSLVDHLEMRRIVVVALQQPFVVRTRPDDRDALHSRSNRQHPIIGQQNDRLGNSPAGQCALLRSLEDSAGGLFVNIGILEESKQKFEAQHAPDGPVNGFKWYSPGLDLGPQWSSIAVHCRQF